MMVHIFCTIPEVISSSIEWGVVKRARDAGLLEVVLHDLHELSPDPHNKIDDSPYGGGPGMVVRVDVVAAALEKVFERDASSVRETVPVVLLSPSGRRFDQETAHRLAASEELAFICGRYEGIDDRVRETLASEELSLGDFVLSGGEIAAAAMLEAISRLLAGVLGNEESLEEESFSSGLLEYPQFTRPAEFNGSGVPEVLLSGDHAKIELWRRRQAFQRTKERRPDLLEEGP
jgi:tRNA (guanine37-N1)-methyltransferase